jgi:uncharacterized membrane protein YphA (DoxX/SURF4 family)
MPVMWAYAAFSVVIAVGIVAIARRRDWQKLRGFELLILLGPIFYAAPLTAFGTEHFTITPIIASIVPKFVPWHFFWAYFVGVCFICAGLSISSRILAQISSSLVGLTFFLFVAMMGVPGFSRQPHNWIASVLMVRELAFSGGALALAATLIASSRERESHVLATIARYFVAVPVTYYAIQQFLHPDHVPGIPLEKLTPSYVPAHTIWPYLSAAVYVVGGVLLLVGKKTRLAALAVGAAVLVVELIVYLPIAVVQRASLEGFNYMADTLMFCGAVLLLAGAMPREN